MREYLCEFYSFGGMQGIMRIKAENYQKAMELGEKYLKTSEITEYYGKCGIVKTIDLTDIVVVEELCQ